MVDHFGNPLAIGDRVIVAVTNGTKAILRKGTVKEVFPSKYKNDLVANILTDVNGTTYALKEAIMKDEVYFGDKNLQKSEG